jgi:hypothetical protein
VAAQLVAVQEGLSYLDSGEKKYGEIVIFY